MLLPPPHRPSIQNLVAILLCWFVFLEPWRASAISLWKPGGQKNQKEIAVHQIKDPGLAGYQFKMEDGEASLDDPDLYYDHDPGYSGIKNGFLYLATWKDEKAIIGMVAVIPFWESDDYEFVDDDDEPWVLRGLILDDVATAKNHRRKGVGTALFQAIENDANELMDTIVLEAKTTHSLTERLPGGKIEISLYSVRKRPAVAFYRSMGFQFEELQCLRDGSLSVRGKLTKRLEWAWLYWREQCSMKMIKTLDPNNDQIQGDKVKSIG